MVAVSSIKLLMHVAKQSFLDGQISRERYVEMLRQAGLDTDDVSAPLIAYWHLHGAEWSEPEHHRSGPFFEFLCQQLVGGPEWAFAGVVKGLLDYQRRTGDDLFGEHTTDLYRYVESVYERGFD